MNRYGLGMKVFYVKVKHIDGWLIRIKHEGDMSLKSMCRDVDRFSLKTEGGLKEVDKRSNWSQRPVSPVWFTRDSTTCLFFAFLA